LRGAVLEAGGDPELAVLPQPEPQPGPLRTEAPAFRLADKEPLASSLQPDSGLWEMEACELQLRTRMVYSRDTWKD
ncbi:RIKEN cDNA 1700055M20, isoform CRA_b, partial [Mus musculus]